MLPRDGLVKSRTCDVTFVFVIIHVDHTDPALWVLVTLFIFFVPHFMAWATILMSNPLRRATSLPPIPPCRISIDVREARCDLALWVLLALLMPVARYCMLLATILTGTPSARSDGRFPPSRVVTCQSSPECAPPRPPQSALPLSR